MPFTVREVFATLQGEGSRTGSPAIFVRLTGCNLWSGSPDQRHKGAGDCARWCDTDFLRGDRMSGPELTARVLELAKQEGMVKPLVVLTGGEPLLQLGNPRLLPEAVAMLGALVAAGAEPALETNGTQAMPPSLAPLWAHITVSPKGLVASPGWDRHLQPLKATDLKIVVPCPMQVEGLVELYPGAQLFFQPMDGKAIGEPDQGALALARQLAAQHGGRVSIQTHKLLGLP